MQTLVEDIQNTFGKLMSEYLPLVAGARMADEFRRVARGDTSEYMPNEHDIAMLNGLQPADYTLVTKKRYRFDQYMDPIISGQPYLCL
jgi:hypothetical protein